MKPYFLSLVLFLAIAGGSSCSSDPNVRQGQTGGVVVGGLAGGLITNSWGGAAVGAAMGGLFGGEMNR